LEAISVLITGGTGSFGNAAVEYLLPSNDIKKIIIFSRDEFKQNQMHRKFGNFPGGKMRFFIGDVRDPVRLSQAMKDVDLVIHAAAMKQVPTCEYNPLEAVKTNILGSQNVIDVAIARKVPKVILLSSDKAVSPINLYGKTKAVAESLFIDANGWGDKKTIFSVVRYGNILASRGSVIDEFRRQVEKGDTLFITDKRMTRFWWVLYDAIEFAMCASWAMTGGEIYVPPIQAASLKTLAGHFCSYCRVREEGIRPGEKLHEILIAPDEIRRTTNDSWAYVIYPENEFFEHSSCGVGSKVEDDFSYCSNDEKRQMTSEQLEVLFERTGIDVKGGRE